MASTIPPPKRKSAAATPGKQSNPGAAAARKRAKTYDARTLAVQSTEAALSTTGELDVAAYVGTREFEIRSLETGMQRSKAALTSRAFQQVPRSLRRRTASHNVKRVPSRLRARAKREMIEDNTPTVTARRRKPSQLMRIRLETARRLQNLNSKTKAKRAASKAGRDKETRQQLKETGSHVFDIAPRVPKIKKYKLSRPPPPESKFQKRQRGKTWLPTHMFHAKRAHMTTAKDPLWRFAVPLSPTEKSYRPSHRAGFARGAVAWDMSYMATIQLEGTEGALESVLRAVGVDGADAWGAKGKKWRAGTRSLQAWVFDRGTPRRPIAPVRLVRCAEVKSEDVDMVDADNEGTDKQSKAKKKDRKKVFVRVHPSSFLQVWNELLELSKRQNPPVMVEDLRFEIGSIEITGPASTEALVSVLKPLSANSKEIPANSPEATWNSLSGISNPSSLPQNAILGFSISDPRLRFPYKTSNPPSSEADMQNLAILLSSWTPDTTQSSPGLFDRPTRLAATRQLPSQKAINRRRAQAGPGAHPSPLDSDPHIPILALASRPSSQPKGSNAPGSWTILLPWKCVLPVWYSLMFYPLSSGGNPRFGGLKEQQQLCFEAGEPWFPGDFPGTRAGWEWGLREREKAKQEWERRPKGRRTEFASVDLGNGKKGEIGLGWACDWERLVQGPSPLADGSASSPSSSPETKEKAVEQKEPSDGDAVTDGVGDGDADAHPPLNIIHLQPSDARKAIADQDATATTIDIQTALATVRISLYSRGTPTPLARVYRLPTADADLRRKWLSRASTKPPSYPTATAKDSVPTPCDHLEHLPLPSEEDLIGFVTTGNYNLSEGRGTGIGSVLVSKVVGGGRGKGRERSMCIVRASGERVGRLGWWEVV